MYSFLSSPIVGIMWIPADHLLVVSDSYWLKLNFLATSGYPELSRRIYPQVSVRSLIISTSLRHFLASTLPADYTTDTSSRDSQFTLFRASPFTPPLSSSFCAPPPRRPFSIYSHFRSSPHDSSCIHPLALISLHFLYFILSSHSFDAMLFCVLYLTVHSPIIFRSSLSEGSTSRQILHHPTDSSLYFILIMFSIPLQTISFYSPFWSSPHDIFCIHPLATISFHFLSFIFSSCALMSSLPYSTFAYHFYFCLSGECTPWTLDQATNLGNSRLVCCPTFAPPPLL